MHPFRKYSFLSHTCWWAVLYSICLPFPGSPGINPFPFRSDSMEGLIWCLGAGTLAWILSRFYRLTWVKELGVAFLSWQLFIYGWNKIFGWQFYPPEPVTLHTELVNLDQDILFWSLAGRSVFYQQVSGWLEVMAATLLLFPGSRIPGACISALILIQVMILNFSFGITVLVHSSFLFLLSLGISSPAWYPLKRLFGGKTAHMPPWEKTPPPNWAVALLWTVVVAQPLYAYAQTGFRPHTWFEAHGTWQSVDGQRLFVNRQSLVWENKARQRSTWIQGKDDFWYSTDLPGKLDYQFSGPEEILLIYLEDSLIFEPKEK